MTISERTHERVKRERDAERSRVVLLESALWQFYRVELADPPVTLYLFDGRKGMIQLDAAERDTIAPD